MRTLLLTLLAPLAFAGEVKVAWDPNPEPDLAGYKIHHGPVSREYTVTIDVGNVTEYVIKGLKAGPTYFSAVTAYNEAGKESGYSNEISFIAEMSATTGYRLQANLQSSEDGLNWRTIASFTMDIDSFEEFFSLDRP